MNIPEFIKKYDFVNKTFFVSELNDLQLEDLKSCQEFAGVKKFNVVSPRDTFFENNAIDFRLFTLKSNTRFNSRVNIHSIHVMGPFPVHDVYDLPDGISQFTFSQDQDFASRGAIVYKYNHDAFKDKFLSNQEIQKAVADDIIKHFFKDVRDFTTGAMKEYNEDTATYKYRYMIGIRCHKESVLNEIGDSRLVTIPVETITNDLKLFAE